MSDFFVGEIRMFSFNWAPQNWAFCDGTLLQITQNQALYSLLGINFGGDGKTTFGLPDLRGRAPLCVTTNTIGAAAYGIYHLGNQSMGGVESVALTAAQVPIHTHSFKALSTVGTAAQPTAGVNLVSSAKPVGTPLAIPSIYGTVTSTSTLAPLNAGTISTVGGGKHDNMQPFMVMNFCIAMIGLYPPRQ